MLAAYRHMCLSERIAIEPIFHRLHRLKAAMGATFVNLHRDFTSPLVNRHNLMEDRPKEDNLFLCLSFVLDDIPLWGGGRRNFILPLVQNWLLEDCLLSNPFLPSLAE